MPIKRGGKYHSFVLSVTFKMPTETLGRSSSWRDLRGLWVGNPEQMCSKQVSHGRDRSGRPSSVAGLQGWRLVQEYILLHTWS